MEENKHTELDKFFKSRLESTAQSENGWNIPPLSILDQALEQVPAPAKPRRRIGFFWIFGLAALLGISTLCICNAIKINAINSEISSIKNNQTSKADIASSSLDNKDTTPVSVINKIQIEEVTQEVSSSNNIATLNNSNNLKQTEAKSFIPTTTPSKERNNTKPGKQVQLNKAASINTVSVPSQSKVTPTARQRDILQSPQEIIAIYSDTLAYEALGVDISLDSIIITEHITNKTSASVFITGGLLNSCLHMTNIDAGPFSLTKYDEFYPGYYFGIGAYKPINNSLNLYGTISFNQITNQSLFENDITYNNANAIQHTDGSMLYQSEFYMETPMASFNDNVAFRLLDNQIVNGETLNNKTNISETYQILTFTIGVDYELFQSKKLSGLFSTGLSSNYIIGIDQTMDSKIYRQDAMMMDKTLAVDLTSTVNRLHLSGRLNLGLQYDLTDKVYLQLNGGYEKGLTSVRKHSLTSLPKTYISSFSSGISLGYTF